MLILITNDVSTADKAGPRRLRRVAQACEDYGVRVQKSVFECQVGQKEWGCLRARLLDEITPERDSLRFYFLDAAAKLKIEHHGTNQPLDLRPHRAPRPMTLRLSPQGLGTCSRPAFREPPAPAFPRTFRGTPKKSAPTCFSLSSLTTQNPGTEEKSCRFAQSGV